MVFAPVIRSSALAKGILIAKDKCMGDVGYQGFNYTFKSDQQIGWFSLG